MDEDTGVTVRADSHSIASLLPVDSIENLHILVSSRPDPPIPQDVPSHHPIRDPENTRPLKSSSHAKAQQYDRLRDLKRILYGTRLEQDILGFVVGSGGGLSLEDLAVLTGASEWEIENHLGTSVGRTFNRMVTPLAAGRIEQVYVMAHEELLQDALKALGSRTEEYGQRIDQWADGFRRAEWPEETPVYLLLGYFWKLQRDRDFDRMFAFATSQARYVRLRALTGADRSAFDEIQACKDFLLESGGADLLSMARLCMYNDILRSQNYAIPAILPSIWFRMGEPERALQLARSMPNLDERASALIHIAHVLTEQGRLKESRMVLSEANTELPQVSNRRDNGLKVDLARELAKVGDTEACLAIAESVEEAIRHEEDELLRTFSLRDLIDIHELLGHKEKPAELVSLLVGAVEGIRLDANRVLFLPSVSETLEKLLGTRVLTSMITEVESMAERTGFSGTDDTASSFLSWAYSKSGDWGKAIEWARNTVDDVQVIFNLINLIAGETHDCPSDVMENLIEEMLLIWEERQLDDRLDEPSVYLARVLAARNRVGEARAVLDTIRYTGLRSQGLAEVAQVLLEQGNNSEMVRSLIIESESIAREWDSIFHDPESYVFMARKLDVSSQNELSRRLLLRALNLISQDPATYEYRFMMNMVVSEVRTPDQADILEQFARGHVNLDLRAWLYGELALYWALHGRSDKSKALLKATYDLNTRIANGNFSYRIWCLLAESLQVLQCQDLSELIQPGLNDFLEVQPDKRINLLDLNDAIDLFLLCDDIPGALDMARRSDFSSGEYRVVEALVGFGRFGDAERMIEEISDLEERVGAMSKVALGLARIAESSRASAWAEKAFNLNAAISEDSSSGPAETFVKVFTHLGEHDRARELLMSISSDEDRSRLAALIARSAQDPGARTEMMRACYHSSWVHLPPMLNRFDQTILPLVAEEFMDLANRSGFNWEPPQGD
ncbi:hypothetical protein [Haloglycomyces albus]|uniref:hypothetical protein n=1 Tax=Haloglycomyces albus TaxID=526067 RepID=UPI00316AC531